MSPSGIEIMTLQDLLDDPRDLIEGDAERLATTIASVTVSHKSGTVSHKSGRAPNCADILQKRLHRITPRLETMGQRGDLLASTMQAALNALFPEMAKRDAAKLYSPLRPDNLRRGGTAWFAPMVAYGRPYNKICDPLTPAARMLAMFEAADRTINDRLSARFFTQYLEHNQDYEGLVSFPLLMAIERAASAIRLAHDRGEVVEAEALLQKALDGLKKHPDPVACAALGGVSGTGKSSLAKRVCGRFGQKPGALVLRSDVIRKQIWGYETLTKKLPPEAYASDISDKVEDELKRRAALAMKAGYSVIIDQTHLDPALRVRMENFANSQNAVFAGIWLYAPDMVVRRRLNARMHGPSVSDANEAVYDMQIKRDHGKTEGWRILNGNSLKENLDIDAVQTITGAIYAARFPRDKKKSDATSEDKQQNRPTGGPDMGA